MTKEEGIGQELVPLLSTPAHDIPSTRRSLLSDGTTIVTPEEVIHSGLFSQARDLLDVVINLTPDAASGKIQSGGGRILPNGTILSRVWDLIGTNLFASLNTDDGRLQAVIDDKLQPKVGMGSRIISLKDYYLREEYPQEVLPDDFPDTLNPETIMLKVYVHTDDVTMDQVERQLAPGFFEDPYEFESCLFTAYFLLEGKIGKLVYLPSTVTDNRTPVSQGTEYGRAIAVPVTNTDRQLIQKSLDQISDDLSILQS